jgi:hypothetical protein
MLKKILNVKMRKNVPYANMEKNQGKFFLKNKYISIFHNQTIKDSLKNYFCHCISLTGKSSQQKPTTPSTCSFPAMPTLLTVSGTATQNAKSKSSPALQRTIWVVRHRFGPARSNCIGSTAAASKMCMSGTRSRNGSAFASRCTTALANKSRYY